MVEKVGEGEASEGEKKKNKLGKAAKVSLGVLGGLSLLMGYISAAGMEESEREEEARKPIDNFFTALNARDIEGCRRTLHYPNIQIAGNEIIILNGPESFQIDFQLLANEGWTYSTLDSCSMRQSCNEKVHFEVQLSWKEPGASSVALSSLAAYDLPNIPGEKSLPHLAAFRRSNMP
jgi:hypothetical protein